MYRSISVFLLALVVAVLVAGPVAAGEAKYHLGSPISAKDMEKWNIDVRSDGAGLPEGSGTVKKGEPIYAEKCAVCHGEFGEGVGRNPILFGGEGTLDSDRPQKRIGGFWPYAPTLFDYIRRTMPFGDGQSLTNDELYSLIAVILNMNELWDEEKVLTRGGLIAIKMPNRAGFIAKDPRPDTANPPCMRDCGNKAVIKSRATLDSSAGE